MASVNEGRGAASLMCIGTPGDVKRYCRWLIDICASGGGYILSMGSGLAGRCQAANLHAMIDTGKEYGVYRNKGVSCRKTIFSVRQTLFGYNVCRRFETRKAGTKG